MNSILYHRNCVFFLLLETYVSIISKKSGIENFMVTWGDLVTKGAPVSIGLERHSGSRGVSGTDHFRGGGDERLCKDS